MAHAKSTDPNIFLLPDLGEGVHEAELISWKVSPGDHVEEHDIIAEMETDKALVEVPSPRSGTIKELFGNVGDILKVGEPAWSYEGGGAGGGEGSAPTEQAQRTADEPKPTTDNGKAMHAVAARAPERQPKKEEEREDAGTVVGTMSGSLGAVTAEHGKALATPAVRRLARDLGVDIDAIAGTGIAGRVTERDVRAATQGDTAATGRIAPPLRREPAREAEPAEPRRVESIATRVSQPQFAVQRPATLVPTGDAQRIPFRGVRRKIAERLRASVDTAVHFTVMDDADVSALDDVRARVGAASGEKVSYLPFIAAAVMRALRKHPALNAHVDDEAGEIIRYPSVNLGIAADTDQGLTVPVIPGADMLGLLELSRSIAELAASVRDRSIEVERLKGSTFTISNVGSYAGKYATPIINYPEVAILAAGRVYEGVIADRGSIRIAKLLPLSLTCDHRSVDGAEAARCLATIIGLLQQPEELLTPARLA